MVPTLLPGPPCLHQDPNTHSYHLFPALQRLSSTLKWRGDSPAGPRGNTLGERPEGPGRENEKLPGTENPHLGATRLRRPPEATTIHAHCSPREGGRGNPDPRALLVVREERGRPGQGTVGSSPRGHTRAGTKHGSPPQFEGGGDRIGSSNTARNTGVELTGRATGHGGGPRPKNGPGPSPAPVSPSRAGSRHNAWGSHCR